MLKNPNLSKASIDKFKARAGSGAPLMRGGDPMEIAFAMLYLASTESSYTTGTEVIVDGGGTTTMGHSPNRFLKDGSNL